MVIMRMMKVVLLKCNNGRNTKSISHSHNINLYPRIIKLLNTEKAMLKKDYGFDEAFNIFDAVDNKYNNFYEYKPKTSNKILTQNVTLQYLRVKKDKLINMISNPAITLK